MAFVRLALFPDATQEHYDAVAAQMAGAPVPPGRLLFAAGPVPGGWQVVQVWSSREELDEFNHEHFLPALARLGHGAFPAPPAVTDFHTSALELGAS